MMLEPSLTWAEEDVGRALLELSRALGWASGTAAPHLAPRLLAEQRLAWLSASARQAGMELQPAECSYGDLDDTLANVAPALLCIEAGAERRYVAVLSSRRRRSRLLTPALTRRWVATRCLGQQLSASCTADMERVVNNWFAALGVGRRRARRAQGALSRWVLAERRIGGIYLLRLGAGAPFTTQLREQGVPGLAGLIALLSVLQVLFALSGWFILGQIALTGVVQPGWVGAWVLTQASSALLQVWLTRLGSTAAREVSLLLKQRLFAGILRSSADEIRTKGSGRLLSLISEAAVLESIGVSSLLTLALGLVELLSAFFILSLGAGASLQPLLLLAWSGLFALLACRYFTHRQRWTEERGALARGFVENVLGYRTRVTQQRPARWHEREDPLLDRYAVTSAQMDAAQQRLAVVPARGWLLVGILGLVPALLSGAHTQAAVTVALGGTLQAYGALGKLAREAVALCAAAVAWCQVGPLFRTGLEPQGSGRALLPLAERRRAAGAAERAAPPLAAPGDADGMLDVRGVSFGHDGTREPVLEDCNLRLLAGERAMLEGPSGSGKSTLAALISGCREPRSGCILLHGLDRVTLGLDGWRRRVSAAPQFNENYLFSASLAFNLLMSRSWPASPADLAEAEAICRELGLGPLLSRMPSRLDQIVGETGWQLSHGERSRVFLARALLQGAELLVLDETFAALDPLTLRQCVNTVLARARTLLVIAHP